MKCLNCDNEATGRSKYCTDTCKTLYNRNKGVTETVTNVTVTPGFETVTDVKCYGRQAVVCSEFKTRPEPLDPTDLPVPLSRGRYVTVDDDVYQFDAVGKPFKCKQGLVYATLQDVAEAHSERMATV
ncbi:hypothetical protein KAR91_27020 [Candidatus Pacearchaeota archaeon]|nr:hypothetical protein [Candidatus Pacearchaeota archaeon]